MLGMPIARLLLEPTPQLLKTPPSEVWQAALAGSHYNRKAFMTAGWSPASLLPSRVYRESFKALIRPTHLCSSDGIFTERSSWSSLRRKSALPEIMAKIHKVLLSI